MHIDGQTDRQTYLFYVTIKILYMLLYLVIIIIIISIISIIIIIIIIIIIMLECRLKHWFNINQIGYV